MACVDYLSLVQNGENDAVQRTDWYCYDDDAKKKKKASCEL